MAKVAPAAGCETGERWYTCHEEVGSVLTAAIALLAADQGSDSVEAITEDVMQIIARELKIPLERLAPDTALQDLGVESLDLIEIIFALEEKFDISIPYNANEQSAAGSADVTPGGLGKLETIEQISAAVKGLVGAKTAA
jgi:acyl carrier protein